MIETSQLQTLVAVARVRSFSKAADDLGVTQSAISQSIKNLEKKLEVKLFKRSGKRVVLTPEGEKLYDLGSGFLEKLDHTLEEISHDKDAMSGKVRIGTLTGVGKSWLAPDFMNLSREFPELTVSIQMGFQEDLVREFEAFRLDFLILPEEALPNVGEKVLLSEERISLVYPINHPDFQISDEITLEELCDHPAILFQTEDQLFMKWCKTRYGRRPKKVNPRYIVNSHGNMLQAVEQGLGIAVVPNHVLKRYYYRDKIGTLSEKSEASNGRFFIVYHKDSWELLRIQTILSRLTSEQNPLL